MSRTSSGRLAGTIGPLTIEVDHELAGQRLDRGLTLALPGTSRTRVQATIAQGLVRVNGRPAKSSLLLEAGMHIEVISSAPEPEPAGSDEAGGALPSLAMPPVAPLAVIYEDSDLLVVDKPAGLVVHPAPGHTGDTLVDGLRSYVTGLEMVGDSGRPGIVHRLDKDTSGLLVVAKNAAAHAHLAEQMKTRSAVKRYLALVEGQMPVPEGVVDAPIGRDPRHRQRMAIVRSGGRLARTRFRTLKYAEGRALLEIQLESGRTHQIRVHMAAIHHPIVGDQVYGKIRTPPQPPRQFLHASHLEFIHPSSQKRLVFDSPLPADLAGFAAPWLDGLIDAAR
jgi:23S rRNA pseudouridine1911/1915/1917 synthase